MNGTSCRSLRSASRIVFRRCSSASGDQVKRTTCRSMDGTFPGAAASGQVAPSSGSSYGGSQVLVRVRRMGRSLRIALLSYRSKPHSGGQGVYVRALSRELTELGHSVEVISGQPYPELDPGVPLTRLPSLDLYREPDPFRPPPPSEFRDLIDVAAH